MFYFLYIVDTGEQHDKLDLSKNIKSTTILIRFDFL